MAKFAVFLVAKILKMHIFLTFLNGYIHPNNFKNKKASPWGFAPNPTLTCEAAGAGGKPYPPTPTVSVGSIQGVKGKMHDFVALLTPLHLRGGSKTNRSGQLETCQGLRSNRVALGLYRLGATTLCGKGAGGFPAPLPRGERGCGQRPRCCKTLGGRAVGGKCAVGTHFKGFGFTRHRASSV